MDLETRGADWFIDRKLESYYLGHEVHLNFRNGVSLEIPTPDTRFSRNDIIRIDDCVDCSVKQLILSGNKIVLLEFSNGMRIYTFGGFCITDERGR